MCDGQRVAALECEVAELRAALRGVEWEGVWYCREELEAGCIDCGSRRTEGHASDCHLAAILARPSSGRGAAIIAVVQAARAVVADARCQSGDIGDLSSLPLLDLCGAVDALGLTTGKEA